MIPICQKNGCNKESVCGGQNKYLPFCEIHLIKTNVVNKTSKNIDDKKESKGNKTTKKIMRKERCTTENCEEKAKYGLNYDNVVHCKNHKVDNEYEVVKNCEVVTDEGQCTKKATFSDEKHIPKRCQTHKLKNTKDGPQELTLSKLCYEINCTNYAKYTEKLEDKPTLCEEHKLPNMIRKGRVCNFTDSEGLKCETVATFGAAGEKPCRCVIHKEEDHESMIKKKCQCKENKNVAYYGPIEDYKTKPPIWCIKCRPDDPSKWIHYLIIKCEDANCKVTASYGPENEKAMRCATHKIENDISYKIIRCQDCNEKAPKYRLENIAAPGGTRLKLCEECVAQYDNKDDKIFIAKRCECGKHTPCFGYVVNDKKVKKFCSECRPTDDEKCVSFTQKQCIDCGKVCAHMSDTDELKWCATCAKNHEGAHNIKSKMCIVCKKVQATFAVDGKRPQWCVTCCPDTAKSMNGAFCVKCETRASFGLTPSSRPLTCFKHKEPEYVSTAFEQCIDCIKANNGTINYAYYSPEGTIATAQRCGFHQFKTDSAYHRKNCIKCNNFHTRQYSDLCCMCDPTARTKVQELAVVNYLRSLEQYKDFKYDTIIVQNTNMYGKYRPDICYELEKYNIIVEVDENAHSDYYGEKDRMINITAGCGKFCVFIRYNPDKIYYRNSDCHVEEKTRLKLLTERIDYYRRNPPNKPLTYEFVYYMCTFKDNKQNYVHNETEIPIRVSNIDLVKLQKKYKKRFNSKPIKDEILTAVKIGSGKIILTIKCQCGDIYKKRLARKDDELDEEESNTLYKVSGCEACRKAKKQLDARTKKNGINKKLK